MERRTAFSIAFTIGITSITSTPLVAHADTYELFAGQHIYAGVVDVCDDGTDVVVTFDLSSSGGTLLETHLYLGDSPPASPVSGRFPYQHLDLSASSDAFAVALSDLGATTGELLYVAAHADVSAVVGYKDPALELDPSIPATVTLTSMYPGGVSYWAVTISDGGALDGEYDGWCVDTSRTMASGVPYTVMPVSSYDPAAAAYVDHPEHLDALNWILNADFIGRESPCGGIYSFSDVQRAIWTLIDDDASTSGLVDWDECRAQEIVAAALVEGEGYEPDCLDAMAVLLVPIDPDGQLWAQVIIAQVTVVDVDLACEPFTRKETAWASGDVPLGRSWASYFSYEVGSSPCE